MIQEARIQVIGDRRPTAGKYVLYWMQQSQRVRFNHALEYAIEQANELKLPLVVCFAVMDDYPEANARHYQFLLEGLRDVELELKERGIRFVCRHGQAPPIVIKLAEDAALVVCDRGYTRHQRRWRDAVVDGVDTRVVQVESDLVVPVEVTSSKQEFAARTIRPKIHKQWKDYLVPLKPRAVDRESIRQRIDVDFDLSDPAAALSKLKVDRSIKPSPYFEGGSRAAQKNLKTFVTKKLPGYAEGRNEPAAGQTSVMSAYLHFGNISALDLALAVDGSNAPKKDRDAYLEELIVRRELAYNFVYYNPNYDRYDALPDWAKKTLAEHAKDKRNPQYTLKELEEGRTHDESWNAAQREMTLTGYMHNYMRMYWGKKILEWTPSPKEGYEATLYLNNKYFLCGRDPISFASVAWIYGLHDRPWGPARPIFGLIRYMNEAGLKRKFDMKAYVKKIDALAAG